MEYITCSTNEQLKIEWKCHIIEGNRHIKFAKSGTEVIEYITANKDKLTENLYALAKQIYLASNDSKHFAYVMKHYNYGTIHKRIPKIDNKHVLLTINKIVNELLAIDVVYWDIHAQNFLVRGQKIVAIDLDEAKIGITPERLLNSRFNYIDLIFHLYIGYLLNKNLNYIDFFLDNFTIENFFSQDASAYIKDIYYHYGEQINRDPSFLISEFEDKERCEYFKSKALELSKKQNKTNV